MVGLRERFNERGEFLITTIPTIDEQAASTTGESLFPHLVDGGGYTTQFILFSGLAGQASKGVVHFFRQNGRAFGLALR